MLWLPMAEHVVSIALRKITQRQLDDLILEGDVQSSSSACFSPGLLINKKDGSQRVWVDYLNLGKITRGLPTLCLRSHAPCKVLHSTLPLDQRSSTRTAFNSSVLCLSVCKTDQRLSKEWLVQSYPTWCGTPVHPIRTISLSSSQ